MYIYFFFFFFLLLLIYYFFFFFFFNDTATTEIYTLSLHDALPIFLAHELAHAFVRRASRDRAPAWLHEGLAQWWEGKRLLPAELRAALAGRPFRTFPEI